MDTTTPRTAHGSYTMQHLSCTPDHEAQFQPLRDALNVLPHQTL